MRKEDMVHEQEAVETLSKPLAGMLVFRCCSNTRKDGWGR